MAVGKMLSEAREARGWDREDAADAFAVSAEAIRLWELDKKRPRRANAEAMDRLYGLNGRLLAALGFAKADAGPSMSDVMAELARLDDVLAAISSLGDAMESRLRAATEVLEATAVLDQQRDDRLAAMANELAALRAALDGLSAARPRRGA